VACTRRGWCCPAWTSTSSPVCSAPAGGTTWRGCSPGPPAASRRPVPTCCWCAPPPSTPSPTTSRPRWASRSCTSPTWSPRPSRPAACARSGCSPRRTRCSSRSSSTDWSPTACGSWCRGRSTTTWSTGSSTASSCTGRCWTPRGPRSYRSWTSCGTPAPRGSSSAAPSSSCCQAGRLRDPGVPVHDPARRGRPRRRAQLSTAPTASASTRPARPRTTRSARSSYGVGSSFTIARRAPLRSASRGSSAAG